MFLIGSKAENKTPLFTSVLIHSPLFLKNNFPLFSEVFGGHPWIYHRQIHHKSKNASWLGECQSATPIVRRSKFEEKNSFSIFFKSNGPVLIHCVDEEKVVDHNYYIENCVTPVVKEIWKQRRLAGTKDIKLLPSNA